MTRSSRVVAALVAAALGAGAGCVSGAEPTGDTAAPLESVGDGAGDRAADTPSSTSSAPGTPATTTNASATTNGSATTTSTVATTTSTVATTTSTVATTTTTTSTSSTTTTVPRPTTACTDVAHVADSTGVFLWDGQYVGGDANTMGERYRSVGVQRWIDDSSGGRSIRERSEAGQTNAVEAADSIRRSGFDGCWVIMIGTNDAANVAAGADLGLEERILRLLFVLGDDPVLWVDAATNRAGTVYRNEHMRAWNEELYRVAAERENVRVVRWSDRVRPEWYVADGIHMGTEGRIWRAAIIASALAEEFPTTSTS